MINIIAIFLGLPRVEHLKGSSLGMLRPYLQILANAEEAFQGQTLLLITKIRKLRPKKVLEHKPQKTLAYFKICHFYVNYGFINVL